MKVIPSTRFLLLLSAGTIPLFFISGFPAFKGLVVVYDLILFAVAGLDFSLSRGVFRDLLVTRTFADRMPVNTPSEVTVRIENHGSRPVRLCAKDEHPPETVLTESREIDVTVGPYGVAEFSYRISPPKRSRYRFGRTAVRTTSRFGLLWLASSSGEPDEVAVYPDIRRARALELKSLGAQSFVAIQRKAVRRGEGREFESMRDYVLGDEMRHISWTATARRSKLTTRQYQIERDQNVIVALDAGRLMTGRIQGETKFETALHAGLAVMSAASRAGDNFGLVVFGRRILRYVPPGKGLSHLDAIVGALHDIEPELVEPSYARALKFIAANTKKRSFVMLLTDLVDTESSKDLIASLKLLRPRHLPLVATIGDRDLRTALRTTPGEIREVFVQSAAAEIVLQRQSALRVIETLGGLTIDVTARTLAPKLLEAYLRVKERGRL